MPTPPYYSNIPAQGNLVRTASGDLAKMQDNFFALAPVVSALYDPTQASGDVVTYLGSGVWAPRAPTGGGGGLTYSGARVYCTSALTISGGSHSFANLALSGQGGPYINSGFWSSSHPDRLTVPAGVSIVRVEAGAYFAWNGAVFTGAFGGGMVYFGILDSATGSFFDFETKQLTSGADSFGFFTLKFDSGPLKVTAGEYFTLDLELVDNGGFDWSGGNITIPSGDVGGGGTGRQGLWFAITMMG
jgi:hypothetical protein